MVLLTDVYACQLCHKYAVVMQASLAPSHQTGRHSLMIYLAPKASTDQLSSRPATQNRTKAARRQSTHCQCPRNVPLCPSLAAGSLPPATRSAPKAGALRARAPTCTCAPRVTAHVVSWGEVGMSKTSCAARCSREARCKACFELLPRVRVGWHTARTLLPPPPPRSSGAPVRWLMARGRRASGVAAALRSRAAGAPATRRRRAVGGACACRARSNGRRRPLVVVVVVAPTPNYLRQASPDRGKYCADFKPARRQRDAACDG